MNAKKVIFKDEKKKRVKRKEYNETDQIIYSSLQFNKENKLTKLKFMLQITVG